MEALPPRSNAAKLLRAPPPLRRPPSAASAIVATESCLPSGTNARSTAATSTKAPLNHTKECSDEIWFVDSFCVTPVIPHSASATHDRPTQVAISETQQHDRHHGKADTRDLRTADPLAQQQRREQHGHQREQRGQRDDDRRRPPGRQRDEKRDVADRPQNPGQEGVEAPRPALARQRRRDPRLREEAPGRPRTRSGSRAASSSP